MCVYVFVYVLGDDCRRQSHGIELHPLTLPLNAELTPASFLNLSSQEDGHQRHLASAARQAA